MKYKSKPIYGFGRNDVDYQVYVCERYQGRSRIIWVCPFYKVWTEMLRRCYSKRLHSKYPTYSSCTVDHSWHSLSAFRAWMISQPWEGNELDKDILFPGNKVYSPHACIFVNHALNSFLIDSGAIRGEWPTGVSRHKQSGKFQARCNNPLNGKYEFLGLFAGPNQAHEAWRAKKHQHACTYADQQTDQRIAQALRQRFATTTGAAQ